MDDKSKVEWYNIWGDRASLIIVRISTGELIGLVHLFNLENLQRMIPGDNVQKWIIKDKASTEEIKSKAIQILSENYMPVTIEQFILEEL